VDDAFLGSACGEMTVRTCLVIWAGEQLGTVEGQLANGTWSPPEEGDTVLVADGSSQTWKAAAADEDGWFRCDELGGGWDEEGKESAGGYAYVRLDSEGEKVVLLHALGHTVAYVNGEPRCGDPSCWSGNADQFGYVRLPILLRPGANHLVLHCALGELMVKLATAKPTAMLDARDATLPDLIVGERTQTWGAVVVINPSIGPLKGITLSATCENGPPKRTRVPVVPPLAIRKVGFRLTAPAPTAPGTSAVKLELTRRTKGRRQTLDSTAVELRIRGADSTHKRTFLSWMDGSVQYYAVNPPQSPTQGGRRPALFLSLHGAGVEATSLVESYASKSWGYVVAPTNRRPGGFDWEDWGAMDALEVLELAEKRFRTDPDRTYLTGHSMGGHGTWHVGQTFPDRFAAIGPSAGWLTRWSYGGKPRPEGSTPMEKLLERGRNPQDTMALSPNHGLHGVYVLHGEADDCVPVTEARTMAKMLETFHHDFVYHEEPGAGHWWGVHDEPGADCVDWEPLFDFFARHVRPAREALREVDFITANPGVSAWCYWAGIEAQIHCLGFSTISVRHDPHRRRFAGKTDNVARLALDLGHLEAGGPIEVSLDGQSIPSIPWPSEGTRIWLVHEDGKWSSSGEPSPSHKGPHRYGPLRMAFLNRPVFCWGTRGTPEEKAWAFTKARHDAETLWYSANASVDVIPDVELDSSAERDRNIILYGNAETNRAWDALLADSPVQVAQGSVRIGECEVRREDLACLFLRPRPGSDRGSVGVVGGSGAAGMRLTDRQGCLAAGGFPAPDCIVRGPEGALAAGHFGLDWSVASGEFVWHEQEGQTSAR